MKNVVVPILQTPEAKQGLINEIEKMFQSPFTQYGQSCVNERNVFSISLIRVLCSFWQDQNGDIFVLSQKKYAGGKLDKFMVVFVRDGALYEFIAGILRQVQTRVAVNPGLSRLTWKSRSLRS